MERNNKEKGIYENVRMTIREKEKNKQSNLIG